MAKAGRRTILTKEIQDTVCKGIIAGLTYEQACHFAGIGKSSLHTWRQKGEKQKTGKYAEFAKAVKNANIAARLRHLQKIDKASEGGRTFEEETVIEKTEVDENGNERVTAREVKKARRVAMPQWQASAWILERRFRDEFGKGGVGEADGEPDSFDIWVEALSEAEEQYGKEAFPEDGEE